MTTVPTRQAAVSRRVLHHALQVRPAGVVVVTAGDAGSPAGATVTSFATVSFDPATIMLSLHSSSTTLAAIRGSGLFNVHVLSGDQRGLVERFAVAGARRFDHSLAWHPDTRGVPVIEGVLACLACDQHDAWEVAGHTVIIGGVTDAVETAGAELLPVIRPRSVLLQQGGRIRVVTCD